MARSAGDYGTNRNHAPNQWLSASAVLKIVIYVLNDQTRKTYLWNVIPRSLISLQSLFLQPNATQYPTIFNLI